MPYPMGWLCVTGRSYVYDENVMYVVYVICYDMSMMIWTGRSTEYGPEGQQRYGMEIPWDIRIGRSHRVMAWKGVCVVCGILGNSLSIYAYSVVWCVSGTSEDRGKAPAWSVHTHEEFYMLWSWDVMLWIVMWYNDIFITIMNESVFLKCEKLFWNLRRYKLVSEPWFEGFGCNFGCIWTQTEDLRKFFINKQFI